MGWLLVIRRILALTLAVTLASMGVPVPVNASGEQEQPSARNRVLTLNGRLYRYEFLGQPSECNQAAEVSANSRRTTAGARKPSRSISHCWL